MLVLCFSSNKVLGRVFFLPGTRGHCPQEIWTELQEISSPIHAKLSKCMWKEMTENSVKGTWFPAKNLKFLLNKYSMGSKICPRLPLFHRKYWTSLIASPGSQAKKKTPCKPYHPQGVPVDQPGLYQVKFSLSTPRLSNGLFRSSTTTLYSWSTEKWW